MTDSLDRLLRDGLIHADWADALRCEEETIASLGEFLRAETAEGHRYLPSGPNVFRAFRAPLRGVRVLILGQDPYPTPGHAIGLSFATDAHVRPLPRSLANIYRELRDDLGIATPEHGDLTSWSDNGVMLLNRVLTVRAGEAGSHRRRGWERVTDAAVRTLVARQQPLVAVLWGRDAAAVKPLLEGTPTIESAHPSPLSASRGFFGSRPFSRVNTLLDDQGAPAVDWSLGATAQ
ncbi:uracil-DNA glycosylase [Agreia sp. COWG]|uniref:uracil-DNA glycosylase n=1 Tax=Agreia sp. COWG TaxID=2773266 RepID=UPI0019272223|nr:uracil-DNA glycosylase [Agreia sp. COWG]CAD6000681.1 Uracil-DNA glycosylase [Agreia sp. COWG]